MVSNRWVKGPWGETSSLDRRKKVDNVKTRSGVGTHTGPGIRGTGTLVLGGGSVVPVK